MQAGSKRAATQESQIWWRNSSWEPKGTISSCTSPPWSRRTGEMGLGSEKPSLPLFSSLVTLIGLTPLLF